METKYGIFISYHRNNVFLDEPSDRVECLWPSLDVPFPILGYSFGAKEMAGTSHTLSCLSKLRSSLEAGKKQPRVWLQYAWRGAEVLLYSFFGTPLVLLGSPRGDSEMAGHSGQNVTILSWKSQTWFPTPNYLDQKNNMTVLWQRIRLNF